MICDNCGESFEVVDSTPLPVEPLEPDGHPLTTITNNMLAGSRMYLEMAGVDVAAKDARERAHKVVMHTSAPCAGEKCDICDDRTCNGELARTRGCYCSAYTLTACDDPACTWDRCIALRRMR